jgi:threonine aldolase
MIDLFSDTHTLPSEGMRSAMAEAEVGDAQLGEDPTTNRLQDAVAQVLGTEAALFLPTGSMCNKVAVAALTGPGDAVVCDHRSHVMRFEGGGASIISGVSFEPIATDDGTFTPEQVAAVMTGANVYQPRTSLVALEQTHNFAGGTVWPLDRYEAVCAAARSHDAAVMTDGARLLNAVVASGVAADRWAAPVDAIWIDFSKGLGAPGGAALGGSAELVAEANRWMYRLGGAMRQSGVLAAAALYGLEHNVAGLERDHANARRLADGLADIGVTVTAPATNMVFFDPSPAGVTAPDLATRLADEGVRVSVLGDRIRAVTHLGVSEEDVDRAVGAIRAALAG